VAGRVDRWTAELRSWQDNTVLKLHTMPKPAVALVNGHAVGAGFSLALACDLRLCSDAARFGTGFRNVGLSADFGMTYFLPRVVGGGVARELMFTAEVIDAQRALALGVANRVWPSGDFIEAALAFCSGLAAGPTAAFARMKENLNLAETAPLKTVLDQEAFFQRFNRLSADHKEAVAAFVEKRSPVFRGE
jgi:2-(1,2-epoxy-1,2-dihydrophenyl)acetyl-CoA isomerase